MIPHPLVFNSAKIPHPLVLSSDASSDLSSVPAHISSALNTPLGALMAKKMAPRSHHYPIRRRVWTKWGSQIDPPTIGNLVLVEITSIPKHTLLNHDHNSSSASRCFPSIVFFLSCVSLLVSSPPSLAPLFPCPSNRPGGMREAIEE